VSAAARVVMALAIEVFNASRAVARSLGLEALASAWA
jgi:hypothetical protein